MPKVSLSAAFAQGIVVGTYIQGYETANGIFVGGAFDWLTPFTVLTGLGLLAGYALLGSTWLIMKTEGRLQEWAYKNFPTSAGSGAGDVRYSQCLDTIHRRYGSGTLV